ncbi:hypothetical protein [Roseateles violae]|uniref:Uncharacterized protein n=1 Tax=Roseateles violae TaxID=3058042 RepID=A0ABT8DMV1_9BURK|nr:hypothetical protein [Pelomonas sp. PFR6]MDN3919721.1 hypothetical protein [Pelomonas sp. PFR6]
MRSNVALLRGLLEQAREGSSLMLPRLEPHPAALVVGLAGVAIGIASVRVESLPWRSELGWLGLALTVIGMLMHQLMQRPGVGWRLDLAARRAEPVGQDGVSTQLDGEGWSLLCLAGAKRRSLALELRHVDGGRPLRLFQTRGGAGREEHGLTSQLADRLAERLGVRREGLSL